MSADTRIAVVGAASTDLWVSRVVEVRAHEITGVSFLDEGGAVVALDGAPNTRLTPEQIAQHAPHNGDFLIELDPNDIYVCPREVFLRKYERPSATMDFGDALRALKAGKRVARAGWNGKGMWLSLSCDGSRRVAAENFWSPHNAEHARNQGGAATVLPSITMKTATGEILMGWLASQTDMLANDWVIVE